MAGKILTLSLLIFLVCSLFFLPVSLVHALNQAWFSLSPADVLPQVGTTFNVDITLDTDGANVKSADSVLTFDPAKLSVVALTPGQIFDTYPTKSFDTLGNIKLSGAMSVATASFSGRGKFGSITFRGVAAGTAIVSFSCTPGTTTESNIIQHLTNIDIIDCTRLTPASYTIAAAIGTPTPIASPTPPPTANLTPTFLLALTAMALLVIGGIKLLLVR